MMKTNRQKKLPSWLRAVTLIILSTFLWTNLSYGSAFEKGVVSHLRPQSLSSRDGGVKEFQARLSENPVDRVGRGLQRQLLRVALLGLLVMPHMAIPSIASSELPASSAAGTISVNPWDSWRERIPQQDRMQLEAKTEGAREEVSESVRAYRAKNEAFLASQEKYAFSLRGYLEKLERWSNAMTSIQQGEHFFFFDEAVLRAVDALKGVLRTQLEAIDKVIAEKAIPPGSILDISLGEFSSLIQEDPQVQGEFIIPPQVLNQASFSVTAQSDIDASNVSIGGTLTVTTARYLNHVFQYELPAESIRQEGGKITFTFHVAQSAQSGRLIRREMDTRGTADEADDLVVGSRAASRIDEGYIASVSFQADHNGNSLLPGGKPVVLGRAFVVANGALRPGSIQITGNNLNALTDTPSPQELVQYPFQFPLSYPSDPVLAPLPEVRGLYGEFNFASLDQRDSNRRSIVSYVVGIPMKTILTRGGTGVETVRLADYPITKVVRGVRAGTVTEIPPGPYTVSFNLLDVDAADPTQDNDRLARVIRSGTLQVGGLQKAASDTTATEGTWFADGSALYTEENGSAEYAVDFGTEAPAWSVVVYARNRIPASLPVNYRFDIDVSLDGQPLGRIRVPADSTGAVRTSGIALGNPSGIHRILLAWGNDADPTQFDTILQLERLLFIRPSVPVTGTFSASSFVATEGNVEEASSPSFASTELERKLSRVPESQRFIIQGLLDYIESDHGLSDAEEKIAAASQEMNGALPALRGAKEEVKNRLDALTSNWEGLLQQQPWSEKEKEDARAAFRAWLSQDAAFGEAGRIAVAESPQNTVVTSGWLAENRKARRQSYGDAYLRFLNLEGPEDLAYRLQYGRPWGSSNLSFFVGGRMEVPYLSPKTEEEKIGDQYKDASGVLADVQRRLQGATDPTEIARLAEQERTLRKQLVSLEDQSAELENAKRLLHLRDNLFFGVGLDYLPDSNFVMSSRVKFGSPLRFEKTVVGYDYLPSLRRHGVRFEAPPYELSHAMALRYEDVFEMGYTAAWMSDPGVWTLFSDYVQAHAIFAKHLRLGIEHGWFYLNASFEEYLKVVQAREAVLRALDEQGISTSFSLDNIFTRGSLSYSWDHLSAGLVLGADGYGEARLRGALFGNMWNIAAARDYLDIRTERRIGAMGVRASVGKDRGEWKFGAAIEGRWGNAASGKKVPVSGSRVSPSLGEWGTLQNPKGMLEGTGVHMRTGKPLEWSRPQLPPNPISGVQKGIASLGPLSHPNEGTSLFISKVRLLDPNTRRLVGLIQNRVDLGTTVQTSDASDALTAERLVKLYALLGHTFEGKAPEKIRLPKDFKLQQLGIIDDRPIEMLNASNAAEFSALVFTPSQRADLESQLQQEKLEKQTTEKGV